MNSPRFRSGFRPAVLATLAAFALAGCGGSSGNPDPAPPAGAPGIAPTGAVGIVLTDAPDQGWDRALATITEISLLSDEGQVPLYAGEETIDLLALGSYAEVFHVAEGVPVGRYDKIRLRLSRLELQRLDAAGEVEESQLARLVANGKIDLNPRGQFVVAADQTLMVQLDFDMKKALKIVEAGASGQLIVRPVVFVRILDAQALERFTRVHGTVRELTGDGFVLCQTRVVSAGTARDELRHCLEVRLAATAGLFDDGADPVGRDAIQPGLELTAIGLLARTAANGPGDGPIDGKPELRDVVLQGHVVQIGPLGAYARHPGTATSTVGDNGRFGLQPREGGLSAGLVQAGTLIVSRHAEFLDPAAIVPGVEGVFEGVPAADEASLLKSTFIVLDHDAATELIEGVLQEVLLAQQRLVVTVEPAGDRCIDIAGAALFLVEEDEGSFSQREAEPGDLLAGMVIRAFGTEPADGCFAARVVLAAAE